MSTFSFIFIQSSSKDDWFSSILINPSSFKIRTWCSQPTTAWKFCLPLKLWFLCLFLEIKFSIILYTWSLFMLKRCEIWNCICLNSSVSNHIRYDFLSYNDAILKVDKDKIYRMLLRYITNAYDKCYPIPIIVSDHFYLYIA